MLDTTIPIREAITVPVPNHIITAEQKIRVTFDTRGNAAAGPVAKAIREAFKRTYPAVALQTRHHTTHTFIRPSWAEISWTDGPSEAEAEAEAIISVALRRLQESQESA